MDDTRVRAGSKPAPRAGLCNACIVVYARTGPVCLICRRSGDIVLSGNAMPQLAGGTEDEIDDRDCRRSIAGILHHRHQRGFRCRRQRRPKCRRPQLLFQRCEIGVAGDALRGDPPPMRWKILRQLLRRQDAVSGELRRSEGVRQPRRLNRRCLRVLQSTSWSRSKARSASPGPCLPQRRPFEQA